MNYNMTRQLQDICCELARYKEYNVEFGICISVVLSKPPYIEYGALYMDGDNQLTIRLDDITEVRKHDRDPFDLDDEWRVTLVSASYGRIDIDAYGKKDS